MPPTPPRRYTAQCGAVGGGPAHAVACRRQRRALGHARPRVAEILAGAGETFPHLAEPGVISRSLHATWSKALSHQPEAR